MGGKYKILVLDLVSETRSQRVVSPQCSGAPATGQRAGDSLRVSGAGAPVGSEAGSSLRSGRDLVSGVAPPPLPVQVPPSVPLARISAPPSGRGWDASSLASSVGGLPASPTSLDLYRNKESLPYLGLPFPGEPRAPGPARLLAAFLAGCWRKSKYQDVRWRNRRRSKTVCRPPRPRPSPFGLL